MSSLSSRNQTLVIPVKIYAEADIKVFWSFQFDLVYLLCATRFFRRYLYKQTVSYILSEWFLTANLTLFYKYQFACLLSVKKGKLKAFNVGLSS